MSFTGAQGGFAYNIARAIARQQQVVGFIPPIAMDNFRTIIDTKTVMCGRLFLAKVNLKL